MLAGMTPLQEQARTIMMKEPAALSSSLSWLTLVEVVRRGEWRLRLGTLVFFSTYYERLGISPTVICRSPSLDTHNTRQKMLMLLSIAASTQPCKAAKPQAVSATLLYSNAVRPPGLTYIQMGY